jgi:hypothetical protein
LPYCASFDCGVDCNNLKNADYDLASLIEARNKLMNELKSDMRGETEISNKIRTDGTLLNMETTKASALVYVKNIIKKIENNLDLQSNQLNMLNVGNIDIVL